MFMGAPVLPQIDMAAARVKMSMPSVIIRIMMTGRPARRRRATRSIPMPTKNITTMANGMASHSETPRPRAMASTT